MNMNNQKSVKVNAFGMKVIYVYKHLDVESHKGWLKVGETKQSRITGTGDNLRIIEQHEASNIAYEVLHTTQAITNDHRPFSDKDIHSKLVSQGIEREVTQNPRTNRKAEWFKTDIETIKRAIEDYKANAVVNDEGIITDFTLRAEQQDAIDITSAYYERTRIDGNLQPEFLWNAKPRFGKTLTAYSFAQSIKAKKVLIITNRPAIADSWFRDFQQFDFKQTDQTDGKHRWVFTASASVRKNLENIQGSSNIITREEQLNDDMVYPNFIHFISLQDIKGQNSDANSYKDKNRWIFNNKQTGLKWDLLIIDESHEGVDTHKSFRVLENVQYDLALHLSGTPFKALASNKFNSNQIYNWSYTDEQTVKSEWNLEDGNNPYAALPKLNIFTYQLSRALQVTAEEAKDEGSEYAFDLGEFFRVIKSNGEDIFAYEDKVKLFLDNLVNPNFQYPFSNIDYLESLRHTFWLLPGVAACKLMKQMLGQHDFFKDYAVILAAGNGDEDRITNTALEEVRNAISGHNNKKHPLETKTITLSCGQLTTGVTVPAWTAVLMLNNVKSPSLYMQTAFRAQNPFEVATSGGETVTKENCYVFDFAPDRILQTLAEMADSGVSETTVTREAKVQALINFLPVIAEDDEGRMHELNANEVLTIPLKLITAEVVSRGFMSNRLFENISGIFGAPQSVIDIINKMNPDEGGKIGDKTKNKPKTKPRIWVDNDNKIHINEDIVVNTSNGLLGDKKYVEIGSDEEKDVTSIKTDVATELRNKNVPAAAANAIMNEIEKKLPKVVAKIPDPAPQAGEPDYFEKEKPDEKPAPKEKTEEEKTRDRLRGFARTIPSFLMAYGDATTTISNFETKIPDDVFLELTSITKDEFKKLRDGFEYEATSEETGEPENRRFDGLFNESVFNASVQMFNEKRVELADYYLTDHNEDIFEYIPPQATNQIFTPKHVVKMMVDGLETDQFEIFKRTDSTFIDLYMKSGLYITEIVKKLFANTRSKYNSDADCVKHILENQVYGLAPSGVLHAITNSLIFGFDEAHAISNKNFVQIDMLPYAKGESDKTVHDKLNELLNGGNDMKFDAVVGNPPYQNGNDQIYAYFVNSAIGLSDLVTLIFPIGWQKPANTNGLSALNNVEFKRSGHFVKVDNYYENNTSPTTLFTGVSTGGVNIMLWNKNHVENDCLVPIYEYGKFVQNIKLPIERDEVYKPDEIVAIWQKVKNTFTPFTKTMADIGSARKPYGFEADPISDPSKYGLILSEEKRHDDDLRLYGLVKRARTYRYVPRSQVKTKSPLTDSWKVFVPKAWGNMDEKSGYLGGSFGAVFVGAPGDICSETYIEFGAFANNVEAENVEKYFKTKFFKAVFYMNKISQNTARETFNKVPQQDFTVKSDIDWSKSISVIDQQLYKKYGLSDEEIGFIESRVKTMG